MFLEKNVKNRRSPFTVFAVLTLAITVLWSGAGITNAQTTPKRIDDFVGDNRTDFTTLRFTTGGPIRWKLTANPASAAPNAAFKREFDYGLTASDDPVVGDYVGDSKSDPTVYRDTNATFYVGNFPTGTGGITLNRAVVFGIGGTSDIPTVQGDYDGDGKTDFALVRVVSGSLNWYIMSSVNNTMRTVVFGSTAGIPTPNGATVFPGADFNGDGRDELVYLIRNAAGTLVTYYIGDAVTGAGVITRGFGNYNTDISFPPADYTGDGRADFVAIRQTQGDTAVWYIGNSQNTNVTGTRFGLADPSFTDLDSPVRGDFDGDGIQDICVWRESNQTFYYRSSLNGSIGGQKSGDAGDFPLGSYYQY